MSPGTPDPPGSDPPESDPPAFDPPALDPPALDPPAAGPSASSAAPLPPPPAGSGVVVEDTPTGRRVTLPRLYTRADVMVAGVSGVVAAGMGAWVRSLAGSHPRPSTAGLAIMAAVTLVFVVVAVSEAFEILAPRVIEDGGDRLVLGRKLGVRTVRRERVDKAGIEGVVPVRDEADALARTAGTVWFRAGGEDWFLGRGLDPETLAWLAMALRSMAVPDR